MFAAVKEYFWPAPSPIPAHANHALVDRTIDAENAREFDSGQDGQYYSYTFIPLTALRWLRQQPG